MKLSALPLLALGLAAGALQAQTVVVPTGFGSSTGNSDNRYPFAPEAAETIPRYQQLHDRSDLNPLVSKVLTGIAFRVNEWDPPVSTFTYSNLEIRLSSTTTQVDQMSDNLDLNVGADETVVYSGAFVMPDLGGSASPNPFDFKIDFTAPYIYTGNGNLLVEIRLQGSTPDLAFYLDATLIPGDSVSRRYQTASGVEGNTLGLILEFQIGGGGVPGVINPMSDCGGAPGILNHTGGQPALTDILKFELDNAQAVGATAFLGFSIGAAPGWPSCGLTVPGFGELLLSLTPPNPIVLLGGGVTWTGSPVPFQIPVPNDPTLPGSVLYNQGLFIDFTGAAPAEPIRPTNGFQLVIGP